MNNVFYISPTVVGEYSGEIIVLELQEGEGEEAETIKCYIRKTKPKQPEGEGPSIVRVFWVESLSGQSRSLREDWFIIVEDWIYKKWGKNVLDIMHYRTIKYTPKVHRKF
jgi:hypothetical protein